MNKEREQEPSIWLVARKFPDVPSALKAYEAARDLLLEARIDASVLRFTLGGASHLAILGEVPMPATAAEKMRTVMEQGSQPTDLPDAVAAHLRLRRRDFKNLRLNYLERRTGLNPDAGG